MKNNFIVINTNIRTGLLETTTYTTLEGAEGLQRELLSQGQPSLLIHGTDISTDLARQAFIKEQTMQEVADYEATQEEPVNGFDSSLVSLMKVDEAIAAIEADANTEEEEEKEEGYGYGWGYEEGFDDDEEAVETLPEEDFAVDVEAEEEVK